MANVHVRRVWSSLTAATLLGALLSLASIQSSLGGQSTTCDQLNATACLIGTCPGGQLCRSLNGTCGCVPEGCCELGSNARADVGGAGTVSQQCAQLTEQECNQAFGQFFPGQICTLTDGCEELPPTVTPTFTPTATPTSTPTSTPTNTPRLPDGALCDDPMDCLSGNCVDDVCCDTVCDQPLQSCNQPGEVGTCSPVMAPAPAASQTGMVLITLTLIAIAAFAMLRRRAANR